MDQLQMKGNEGEEGEDLPRKGRGRGPHGRGRGKGKGRGRGGQKDSIDPPEETETRASSSKRSNNEFGTAQHTGMGSAASMSSKNLPR